MQICCPKKYDFCTVFIIAVILEGVFFMASVTMEQCVEEEKDEPLVLLPRGKRMFFVAIRCV